MSHSNIQVLDVSSIATAPQGGSESYDGGGRCLILIGTALLFAIAYVMTTMIGPGVLALPRALAQLGWIPGLIVMLFFSSVAYCTLSLQAACSRRGGPISDAASNYTYMDAIKANLGRSQVIFCVAVQFVNLFATAIGYNIASSMSMMAIQRSNCFHSKGHDGPCKLVSSHRYTIVFGAFQTILSQYSDFDQIRGISIVSAVMPFTYPSIGLSLEIAKCIENGKIGVVTHATPTFREILQVLGVLALAYSYTFNLNEIQPMWALSSTPVLLAKFSANPCSSPSPEWYWFPKEISGPTPGFGPCKLKLHRLAFRTIFVAITTTISIFLPFFNDALRFWPFTVYFPLQIYFSQNKIPRRSSKWIVLQFMSVICFIVSIGGAVGSVAGMVSKLKH